MGKLISLIVLALLAGCSNKIRIYAQHSPEYDFHTNRQFSWYVAANPIPETSLFSNPVTDQKMKDIISDQMASRGYTLSQIPSSLIFHHYIVLSKPKIPSQTNMRAGQSENTQVTPPAKISAIIILYLVDLQTSDVVWRGCTMHQLQNPILTTQEETLSEINGLLEGLIPTIFTHFPIAPLKINDQ